MKGWVSKSEMYPVYYLAVEDDDDAGMGDEIEFTEDEFTELGRAWDEFEKWQDVLAKRAGKE